MIREGKKRKKNKGSKDGGMRKIPCANWGFLGWKGEQGGGERWLGFGFGFFGYEKGDEIGWMDGGGGL